MSTVKPGSGPQRHACDLKLLCANDESVLVCSELLRDATRSPAIKDIVDTASAGSPKELPVRGDSAETWRIVGIIIQHPLTPYTGLNWGNIAEVIKLADKYDLPLALQACEGFITTAVAKQPQVSPIGNHYGDNAAHAFGHLPAHDGYGHTFKLELSFLELLYSVNMYHAPEVLGPLYVSLLHKSCTELKEKRIAMAKQLTQPQASQIEAYNLYKYEEQNLAASVRRQAQAMRKALGSFGRSSANSEVAARVDAMILNQMVPALEELASNITS